VKHITRGVLLMIVLAGSTVVLSALAPRAQGWLAVQKLGSADAGTRKRGLGHIRDERVAFAAAAVAECLARETDPEMVELAGYTLMRTRDPSGVPPLQERADREGDSMLAARLILFAARLADGDYRLLPWLQDGARSSLAWRQAGSALALLHLSRIEAGPLLFERRASYPPEVQEFALAELRGFVELMSQAVGRPMAWSQDLRADWAAAAGFWRAYATTALLRDVLVRMQRSDPNWREVDRLMHARDRVSRWIH
jgi:hypothetical protein